MSTAENTPRKLPGSLNANRRLDRWLRINRDGTVSVFPGKVEIGQGILTALSQIVAEELDVGLERVRLAPTDTRYSPDEGMTSGSQSITDGGAALRYAAAEARDLLMQKAASQLGVSLEQLSVTDGTIRARGGGSVDPNKCGGYADVNDAGRKLKALFEATVALETAVKGIEVEVRTACDAMAKELGVSTLGMPEVISVYEQAVRQGLAKKDISAIAEVMR